MKSRRREGMVRRPAEYALIIIGAVLLVLLLSALFLLNRQEDKMTATNIQGPERPIEGTIDEIDWLTEYDIQEEGVPVAILRLRDQERTASIDAAADNIGSAVDETNFPVAICEELGQVQERAGSSFTERINVYGQAKVSMEASHQEHLREMSDAVTSSRSARDVERARSVYLLTERSNPKDHELVGSYHVKVEEAVAKRRAAFDQARSLYIQQVNQLLATRNATIEQGYASYNAETMSTLAATRVACTRRGVDQTAIRQELSRTVADKRLKYAEILRNRAVMQLEVRALSEQLAITNKAALAQFEQTLQALQSEYQDLRR